MATPSSSANLRHGNMTHVFEIRANVPHRECQPHLKESDVEERVGLPRPLHAALPHDIAISLCAFGAALA